MLKLKFLKKSFVGLPLFVWWAAFFNPGPIHLRYCGPFEPILPAIIVTRRSDEWFGFVILGI
jgi:hypothetical protein